MKMNRKMYEVTWDMTVPPPLGAEPQGNKECIARDTWVQKK